MPYFGKGGFSNQSDISWEKWHVAASPKDIISVDDEGAVEDRRFGYWTDYIKKFCFGWHLVFQNLPSLASFHYTGNDPIDELSEYGYVHANTTFSPSGDLSTYFGANECYSDSRRVNLGESTFCQVSKYQKEIHICMKRIGLLNKFLSQ